MNVKPELIKAILTQLDEEYPRRIDNQDYIVEQHQDREEVIEHLFFLKHKEMIEFKDWSSRTSKACGLIRIIMPEGRTYLKEISKSSTSF